jgi:hypothetical protein
VLLTLSVGDTLSWSRAVQEAAAFDQSSRKKARGTRHHERARQVRLLLLSLQLKSSPKESIQSWAFSMTTETCRLGTYLTCTTIPPRGPLLEHANSSQQYRAHHQARRNSPETTVLAGAPQRAHTIRNRARDQPNRNLGVPDGTFTPYWSPKIDRRVSQNPSCGIRDNTKNHRHVSHKADYDAESRFELYLLSAGESKVEYKEETRKFTRPLHPASY